MAKTKAPKNVQASLDTFVDRLVEEKGLTNLEPDVLVQMKTDLRERLDDRINVLIVEKMPADKLEEFDQILETGNENEIQSFCQKNIPDLEQVVAAELLAFRQSYLMP